jgi:hypothetical protein
MPALQSTAPHQSQLCCTGMGSACWGPGMLLAEACQISRDQPSIAEMPTCATSAMNGPTLPLDVPSDVVYSRDQVVPVKGISAGAPVGHNSSSSSASIWISFFVAASRSWPYLVPASCRTRCLICSTVGLHKRSGSPLAALHVQRCLRRALRGAASLAAAADRCAVPGLQ